MVRTIASKELKLSSPKVEDPPPSLSSLPPGVLGLGVVASVLPDDDVLSSLSS